MPAPRTGKTNETTQLSEPERPDSGRSSRMRDKPVPGVLIRHTLQSRDDGDGKKKPTDDISRLPGCDQRAHGSEAQGNDDVLDVEVGEPMKVRTVGESEDNGEPGDATVRGTRAQQPARLSRRGAIPLDWTRAQAASAQSRVAPCANCMQMRAYANGASTTVCEGGSTTAPGLGGGRSRTRPSVDFGPWVNHSSAFPVRPRSPLAWSAPRAVP